MENISIWERLSSGDPVDMTEPDYRKAVEELRRCEKLNFEINRLPPDSPEKRELQNELLDDTLDETSTILTPAQIDMGKRLKVGKRVFINHSFTAMACIKRATSSPGARRTPPSRDIWPTGASSGTPRDNATASAWKIRLRKSKAI